MTDFKYKIFTLKKKVTSQSSALLITLEHGNNRCHHLQIKIFYYKNLQLLMLMIFVEGVRARHILLRPKKSCLFPVTLP